MDAPKTPEVGATIMFGSNDTKRQIMNAAGTSENVEYLLNVSNFETAGYRNQSSGKKEQVTAKFKINFSEDTKLTTLVNWFDQTAQDPGGLPRVAVTGAAATPSVFTDPKGVSTAAINAKSRVARSHTQIGFNLEHTINANNAINLMTYVGTRKNMQILPAFSNGKDARTSEISREFYGTDLRWDNNGTLFNKSYTLSAGLNYGNSKDVRLDTQTQTNFSPSNTLNRQEDNIAENFDQYVQGKLAVLENVDLHAGMRRTKVNLKVKDNFLSDGDNSGTASYQKTTPVVGAVWKVSPAFNLYANYGKGFETPTFIEAAYNNTSASATPNLSLKPSESSNYEVGAKAFISDNTQANLTLYKVTTDNELVVQASGDRTVYTNANTTKRSGIELSIDSRLSNNFSVYAAYTLLDAKFASAYKTINAGNLIPGTYKTQLYGEIAWKHDATGFNVALEGRHNSKSFVNDINIDSSPAYTIFNVRTGFKQNLGNWQFSEYVRVENMFDKNYIGSVRVNDANLRFFEAATGRNYLVGLGANYRF
jgi:iron complex outermembrane receptor protein